MSDYIDIAATADMIEAAKATFQAARSEPEATEWQAVAEPWYGYLAEDCVQTIYEEAGIPVVWDGGVNGLPDFQLPNGVTGDVKTFTIHKGPFLPSYSVGVLTSTLAKLEVPDGLVHCVWDEGEARLTVIGTSRTADFLVKARVVEAGEKLASGATARAREFQLVATQTLSMTDHLARVKRSEGATHVR